jgi:hypothetical protein
VLGLCTGFFSGDKEHKVFLYFLLIREIPKNAVYSSRFYLVCRMMIRRNLNNIAQKCKVESVGKLPLSAAGGWLLKKKINDEPEV